jgi:hypothetical protein
MAFDTGFLLQYYLFYHSSLLFQFFHVNGPRSRLPLLRYKIGGQKYEKCKFVLGFMPNIYV